MSKYSFKKYCEQRDLKEGLIGKTIGGVAGALGPAALGGAASSLFGIDPKVGYVPGAFLGVPAAIKGAEIGDELGDKLYSGLKKGWNWLTGKNKNKVDTDETIGGKIQHVNRDLMSKKDHSTNASIIKREEEKAVDRIYAIKELDKILTTYDYPRPQIEDLLSRPDKNALIGMWVYKYWNTSKELIKNIQEKIKKGDRLGAVDLVKQLNDYRKECIDSMKNTVIAGKPLLPEPRNINLSRTKDFETEFIPDENPADIELRQKIKDMYSKLPTSYEKPIEFDDTHWNDSIYQIHRLKREGKTKEEVAKYLVDNKFAKNMRTAKGMATKYWDEEKESTTKKPTKKKKKIIVNLPKDFYEPK